MEIIEQIGSYAGLAAILGLAVLSALFFSQARDLRRLREAEESRAMPPISQPAARTRSPQAAAPPAGQAVPTGKGPGAPATGVTRVGPPAPVGATPVASEGGGPGTAAAKEGDGESPAVREQGPAGPGEGPPAPAPQPRPAAATAKVGAGAPASAQGGNAGGARPIPPRPSPPPGAAALRLGEASARRARPWYRRLEPRYLALIVAGALVLGVGGVVGITTLTGEDDGSAGERARDRAGQQAAAPLDPSTITVAVLNGTSIDGAADQVANLVESAGYQRGTVDNAAEQSAESVVLFADGARPAARQVGRELDIPQLELIDPETESLVGTSDVTVIVGADQA